jgi:histone-arginine methyltransferase CARM1
MASMSEEGRLKRVHDGTVVVEIRSRQYDAEMRVLKGSRLLRVIPLSKDTETAAVENKSVVMTSNNDSYLIRFTSSDDAKLFIEAVKNAIAMQDDSPFTKRTDASSAEQYFQFYGYLSQQQNMMQDYVRTSTYQRAMLENSADFQDKVVLDVGAGSGILSFFAVQAGAQKVYAVEASSMAQQCDFLVQSNLLSDRITVVAGKVEEIELPELVDVIISEPMGYMLFNERMLETFLHAKKWLKPDGRIFPSQGDLHIAPFTDDALYMEQYSKAHFWYQKSFHGVDLSSLQDVALTEYFHQPVVDTFDTRICMSESHKYTVDFTTASETDLHDIIIPVTFDIQQAGNVHGLAFWFEVAFFGSQSTVWLSTSPTQPLTHWYQVRCLLPTPVFVRRSDTLVGCVHLRSNSRQSYDVDIEVGVAGSGVTSSNTLDLKNPCFRYTGQPVQAPPGTNHTSPTDAYWASQDAAVVGGSTNAAAGGEAYEVTMLNGEVHDLVSQQFVQQQQQPLTVLYNNNILPLGNVAPVNPGCIPAAAVVGSSSLPRQVTYLAD